MRVCAFCKTRYQKGSEITFHKFPTDSTKQLWLKNMQMENWSPKSNYHLCSKHFTKDCFVKHAARTSLKKGSVPIMLFVNKTSVCDDMATPTPCLSETVGVKRKLSSIDVTDTSSSQKMPRTIPEVGENIEHDHHYENILSRSVSEVWTNIRHDHRYENKPRSTNKMIQRVKKSLNMSRARVKVLSQHVKRLKITVSSLKTIITDKKKRN